MMLLEQAAQEMAATGDRKADREQELIAEGAVEGTGATSATKAVSRQRGESDKIETTPVAECMQHSSAPEVSTVALRLTAVTFAAICAFITLMASQVFAQSNQVFAKTGKEFAQACELPHPAHAQSWRKGWDKFDEPLDFTKSKVFWSILPPQNRLLTVYRLRGAQPSKLYQVGVHLFCFVDPEFFGQFPTDKGGCPEATRQDVTARAVAVEFGVVTTDMNGDGCFGVIVGPIAPGTYRLEFNVRDGAGCNLTGGFGSCDVDFQSPGPFGTVTRIVVPNSAHRDKPSP